MNIYDEKELEKAREFFRNDRFATENGAVIEAVGENYAKVSLKITDRHRNAVGGVMGGVYFTIADFAFAIASNLNDPNWVSLTSDISFLGVPKTETVYAETELIKSGRTVCCYIVKVTDGESRPLAEVKVVGCRVTR
ncbi:MAG: PaaI family thioesterase [Ruminococcus sp.]|nr:PaaI family thioesterase [Ruminococcus sp.]MBR4622768.1 PaaI family thioesterase [Ruminococcus sp.]